MKQSHKPKVAYFAKGDPTVIYSWVSNLKDINVITTKKIDEKFINTVIYHKNKIFLHIIISGLGQTPFEPNIPSVKQMFSDIKKLIDKGFPRKQILIIVKPIIPNDNGLKAIELLLKLFTEYPMLRLRNVRFELLKYYFNKNDKQWYIANKIINNRVKKQPVQYRQVLKYQQDFRFKYKMLLQRYPTVITIDNEIEPIIGNRELIPFGYTNRWNFERIVVYKNKKPINLVNLNPTENRCINRCILCPFKN